MTTRILVVDDDQGVRDLVALVLRDQGYDVEGIPDGGAFLARLERERPDLVVLDILMPSPDGFEVLERLKADERWADVPVVVLSSFGAEDAEVRTLGLGAADHIRKPFRVRELLARVQVQLRARAELDRARGQIRRRDEELERAREEARHRRAMVDILHEVTGGFSSDEIYHVLARRVARALTTSHCSIVLARPGDQYGLVATAYEHPPVDNFRIQLAKYPEIRRALSSGQPVLVEDVATDPLYAEERRRWAAEGITVAARSVIALPFALSDDRSGVFFLRRTAHEAPLNRADVEFADTVVKAAVSAIQRVRVIESARADNARLEELARTDALTGLANRRVLVERLQTELDRARRYDSAVAVLMVDLDHFKRVNDRHGHLVGDEVLRTVAARLTAEVRTMDVVARYGGEEFVIVLPETSLPGAIAFAERVRERIATETVAVVGGVDVHVTASIGLAAYPDDGVGSVEDLLARADEALYRAKADGRDRVRS